MEERKFQPILLAVIYDPKNKKVLIGKRKKEPHIKELKWCFPGGKPDYQKKLEEVLKKKVKSKTGFDTSNLGTIFVRIAPEKEDQILIYYLCEVIGGNEKPGDDLEEIKWVSPEKLENHFTTSFHPHLKEYIINLK